MDKLFFFACCYAFVPLLMRLFVHPLYILTNI